MTIPRIEEDSAWKEIIDLFFKPFMEFFFSDIALQIDWTLGYEMWDKELQKITKDSMTGKRCVDKLVKVILLDGEERLILLHIEIQGSSRPDFTKRMYTYFYRLSDHYQLPVLPLAVLTDNQADWCPDGYQVRVAGMKVLDFYFRTVKILDYAFKRMELTKMPNIFGLVVLAQLTAIETKKKGKRLSRLEQKIALAEFLLDSGRDSVEIEKLLCFIDWVLTLPKELELNYNETIQKLEGERNVSYVTSAERFGIEKGVEIGLQQGIERGMEQGMQLATKEIVQNMIEAGMPIQKIAKIARLTLKEVEALLGEKAVLL